ncbi:MAG: hypothetical protein J6T84_04290 [Spirochaetaceae bacterium]|nr:hypothetical protein [Spirochaetaceae bacterium]
MTHGRVQRKPHTPTESFIEFYNKERPKERLGWLSPVRFRMSLKDV